MTQRAPFLPSPFSATMVPTYFQFSNDYGISFPSADSGVREEGYFFRRFRGLVYPWNKDNSSIIGRGGSGVIHIVRDEIMNRVVALKLPNESILEEPQVRSEVLEEASQALELTHPNIVRIFDFHDQDGRWGISMQFVRGKSLDKWREKLAPYQMTGGAFYDVEQIKPWVLQLCDALSYAHEEAGIVHCDIKPPNLLLERWFDTRMRITRERLLLTDFGITQKLRDFTTRTQRHRGTRSGGSGSGGEDGGAAGTLAYMSPQQLAGKDATVSDDIYAVGMTIYELLTGRPAFYQGDAKVIQHQIERVAPPSMMERRLERGVKAAQPIPDLWEQVTAQCLHKDADKRPASIRELARLLGLKSGIDAGLSLEEQSRLQKEADNLKNRVESKDAHIVTLTTRVGELEAASSGKVEEAALIEAREQLQALHTDLSRRDAQLREYDEKLQDIEEEKLQVEERLAEIQRLFQEAASGGDSEREQLAAQLQEADDRAEQLRSERENLQKALKDREQNIAALNAKIVEEERKSADAIKLAKTADARIKQVKDDAEQARRALEDAQAKVLEKARRLAEEVEAKARQSAAESESTKRQLNELVGQHISPLRPVLKALVGVIVGGLILGLLIGKMLNGSSEDVSSPLVSEMRKQIDKGGLLVLKSHVQVWLRQIGLEDLALGEHFASLPPDSPATGLNWLEAAAFCDWLTQASGLDPAKEWLDLPSIKELPIPGGKLTREWTREEVADSTAREMRLFSTATENSSLPRIQKANDIGFHVVLRNAP